MTHRHTLLLTAALSLSALPPRAEGEDADKAARNLQNLLSKHNGDAIALAATLLAENAGYRDTIRDQKATIEKASVPDGAMLLSKEQAEQWAAYQKLGAPADVEKGLTDGKAAGEKLTTLERRETLRTVADKVGYKAGVLERLGADLTYEEVEVPGEKAGETVKTYGVKGADGKVVPLAQYASTHWSDFLPALTTDGTRRTVEDTTQNRVFLGGNGGKDTQSRTPEQIAADKRASGDYSM